MAQESRSIWSKLNARVEKVSRNTYLKAVSDSMMALTGLMIFGSIIIIFQAFPIASVAVFSLKLGLLHCLLE